MRKTYILSLLLMIFHAAWAQNGRFYTTNQGLSSTLINQIYQDRNGFLWIATEYGLNKYDGYRFQTYTLQSRENSSIRTNYIQTLYETHDGRLLVGGINGLMEYDENHDTFKNLPLIKDGKEVQAHISTIYRLHRGETWISTSGQGLFLLHEEQQKATYMTSLMKRLNFAHVNQIYEDSKHRIWLGTEDEGIYMIDAQSDQIIHQSNKEIGESRGKITAIIENPSSREILIGTQDQGALWYNEEKQLWKPVLSSEGVKLPITVFTLMGNYLLVGTDGQGVKKYNAGSHRLEDYTESSEYPELSHGKIHSILYDRSNNLWLGLFQKGIFCLPKQRNAFGYFGEKRSADNPIGRNCVMSIYQDRQSNLWVGTDSEGLYELTPDRRLKKHYLAPDLHSSTANTILCTFEDSEGNFWIGSYTDGLSLLDRNTGKISKPLPISCPRIYAFAEDKEKNLYIGTGGNGFYQYNLQTKKLVHYESMKGQEIHTDYNVLPNNWINTLFVDREGKLWIGHYKGVTCFCPVTNDFKPYQGSNNLIAEKVGYCFNEDKEGNIWIGTAEGLYLFRKKKQILEHYGNECGIQNSVICSVTPVSKDCLWISTYRGITQLNPIKKESVCYYSGDGLQGNEFTHGASFFNKEGMLYLGGTNGVTFFKPSNLRPNVAQLEVKITDFILPGGESLQNLYIGNHPIAEGAVFNANKFTLSHENNNFRIGFSTFQYQSLGQTVYQYRIVELDKHWSSTQPGENYVSYNHLSPGHYTFQVRASNHSVTSQVRTVLLIISPPWYEQWWANLLEVLLGILVILWIINYFRMTYKQRQARIERIHTEEFNEAKQQFFINISHEIRTPLTLIINPLEQIMKEPKDENQSRQLMIIYKNAQRIRLLINQLMDLRKIEKGLMSLDLQPIDMVALIQDVMLCFEDTAKKKRIQFSFTHSRAHFVALVDSLNFDKVLMNLLSNAFKYTPANGCIDVELKVCDEEGMEHYYEIRVSDTGIGLDPVKVNHIFERFYQIDNEVTKRFTGSGVGLHLSQQIVNLHHGTLRAENRTDGRGSCFTIHIPFELEEKWNKEEENISETRPLEAKEYLSVLSTNEQDLIGEKERKRIKTDIFIVEDDEDLRSYYTHLLSQNYQIKSFENGKFAYEELLKNPPKLVISDVMMPDMDGYHLCEKIKQNVRINHIPVILLTAKSSIEDNTLGMKAGADAFFVKPINIELMKSSIKNLIDNRKLLHDKYSGVQEQKEKLELVNVTSANEQLMNKIMKVINENISNSRLNVEMLSDEVGLSRVHLYRKVKELTSLSVHEFIINLRLKQAERLLSNPELSVADIAYASGFTSTSHLSGAFKKSYGCSPSEYRLKLLQTN